MIDLSGDFGSRAAQRLDTEIVVWLTTVSADGTPQPTPVWFLWENETVLIYSKANQAKLRNIQRNPRVALHFDSDGTGGNVVVITGEARIDSQAAPANAVAAYLKKYREEITGIEMTPESFAKAYAVAIRVTPTGLRGF
jgi:PPOX class probable F420-dependent enzyme